MSKKFRFWAEFLGIFSISWRTVLYVMRFLAIHHWWNFCTNPTSFGGVILEKPLRSSQKSNFLLFRKPFKIYNFTTRNATMMKLITLMYLSETFYSTKNWGVTHRAWEGANRKPLKMCLQTVFLTEFHPFLDSTIKIVTYMIDSLVLIYYPRFPTYLISFWGVMAKKRPKISLKSYFLFLR